MAAKLPMAGTAKQVEWAKIIRDRKAGDLERKGMRSVLMQIRPHVSAEKLDAMGCTTQEKMKSLAWSVCMDVFSRRDASNWISDRDKPALDMLEDSIKSCIPYFVENRSFE